MDTRVLLYSLPPSGGDLFPVSLGYIAAALKRHGVETVISEIDSVNSGTGKEMANFILAYKPAFVGFSIYQANIKLALQMAKIVKMIDPSIWVVFGGPQATFMPKEAIPQMGSVDVLVKGEGETVLPELVAALSAGRDVMAVRGIVFEHAGRVYETAPSPFVARLDDLASPYLENVFDLSQHATATMISSRGCGFSCAFCYTPSAFGRTVRAHSPGRVIADMSVCVARGIRRFFFADPSFTFDRRRAASIMAEVIRRRWRVQMWVETRSDLVDGALLRIMARAGVTRIAYGLESADPEVNKACRKNIDLAAFASVVRKSQALGMEVEVFTLYGLPGQNEESAARTVEFLRALGIDISGNSGGQKLNLFFGTDVARDPGRFGLTVGRRRRPLYVSPGVDFVSDRMDMRGARAVARLYAACRPQKESGECISLL